MAETIHYHSKRVERGHHEEILDQRKNKNQLNKLQFLHCHSTRQISNSIHFDDCNTILILFLILFLFPLAALLIKDPRTLASPTSGFSSEIRIHLYSFM